MHPINKILHLAGLSLSRVKSQKQGKCVDTVYKEKLDHYFHLAQKNSRGFRVFKDYRYQGGDHPVYQSDLECEFVAYHIYKANPTNILDIGSWRMLILGMLTHYNVTSIDIRERKTSLDNETVLVCNAKSLDLQDNSFGAVISLQALPHFGLGRYGDDFDLDADLKGFKEMIRVLKPGGIIIFSVAITGAYPSIAFNARRNYNYEMINNFCKELDCIDEKFIDTRSIRFCTREEITTDATNFDYYIGCWKKGIET